MTMDSKESEDMDMNTSFETKHSITAVDVIYLDELCAIDVKLEAIEGSNDEVDPLSFHEEDIKPEPMTENIEMCEDMQEVFIKMEPMVVESSYIMDPFVEEIHAELDVKVEGNSVGIDSLMADNTSSECDTQVDALLCEDLINVHKIEKISIEKEIIVQVPENKKDQESGVQISKTKPAGQSEHPGTKKIDIPSECPKCNKVIVSKKNMREHDKRVHSEDRPKKFACSEYGCDKTFSEKRYLLKHSAVHSGLHSHKCKHCDKSFKYLGDLSRHTSVHDNRDRFECDICLKTFSRKENVKNHILLRHVIRNQFQNSQSKHICKICHMSYPTAGNLSEHYLIHIDVRNFECDSCESTFLTKKAYQHHRVNVHVTKSYPCEFCTKTYLKEENLVKHKAAAHADMQKEKNLSPCPHCNRLIRKKGMIKHLKSKHPEDVAELFEHTCDVCMKSYRKLGELKTHMRIHARDVQSYECEICEQEFSSSTKLEGHLRCHVLGLVE